MLNQIYRLFSLTVNYDLEAVFIPRLAFKSTDPWNQF